MGTTNTFGMTQVWREVGNAALNIMQHVYLKTPQNVGYWAESFHRNYHTTKREKRIIMERMETYFGPLANNRDINIIIGLN